MTWRDYLTNEERDELRIALERRDKAKEYYNATRRAIKSRCESRMSYWRKKQGAGLRKPTTGEQSE